MATTLRDRARGCLLGCLVGDALGSIVEFKTPAAIKAAYPDGLSIIGPSPVWGTLAGQPTDDGELMLALARTLAASGHYDAAEALRGYVAWYDSGPFDCGGTIASALQRAGMALHRSADPLAALAQRRVASEANGALMRQAPLAVWTVGRHVGGAVFGAAIDADTALTHPNPVCRLASEAHLNGLVGLLSGLRPRTAWAVARAAAADAVVLDPAVALMAAEHEPPRDYVTHQGHVLVALQNAWYQALHAEGFEEGLVDTVMRGGDTDTNACIAGGLLGALYGEQSIPFQWAKAVLTCKPDRASPKPRLDRYWPGQVLDLADRLIGVGS